MNPALLYDYLMNLQPMEAGILGAVIVATAALTHSAIEKLWSSLITPLMPKRSNEVMVAATILATFVYAAFDMPVAIMAMHELGFAWAVVVAAVPVILWLILTLIAGPMGAIIATILIFLTRL